MSLATRLKWFLDSQAIDYEVLHHRHTGSSLETAEAAHIPGDRVAKSVLLEDDRGYVVAVLPASHRIALDELSQQLGRELELASEAELSQRFADCEVGAVPPVGRAYNLPTVVDSSLMDGNDVWFEGGDHEDLIHVSGDAFRALLPDSQAARFSRPA